MPLALTLSERFRLRSRQLLEVLLRLVPLRIIEGARRRHVMVPLLRHRSLRGLDSFTLGGNPPITLSAVDSRLTRILYWYGDKGYEGNEVAWWRRLCAEATGIVEMGANIGYYTVVGALAAPSASYTAIEANPGSVDIVRRNLQLNSITHVELITGAVMGSPEAPTIELALPDLEQYAAPSGAYVRTSAEGVGARRAAQRTISVPTVRTGDVIGAADLIKLDIEGAEYDVLHSSLQDLIARRVTLLVEVLRDTPQLRALLVRMTEHGYRFWLVSEPALREVPASAVAAGTDILSQYGSRDIAVIPDERRALFD
ncbi:FkbM family methyltransferase [uncultured Jatrophihabitans sp.]|uniref:FkbM family methyltransferase n=1 Tax=uncultured Jatrophihabitans sp. TaxID=1610747 RepID=UPI0035CB4841